MELLLPHLDGTLMNQVNNVKTDGETNKQIIVAHTFPPYRHRFHKWLEPQRSAGLQNVYLDPSYLVLGNQHNPSPPPLTLGSVYMELWDVSAVPSPVSLVKSMAGYKLEKNLSRIVSGRRAEVFTWEKIVPRERVTLPAMARQLALPRVSHSETSSPSLCEWSVKFFKGINEKLVQSA